MNGMSTFINADSTSMTKDEIEFLDMNTFKGNSNPSEVGLP